MNAHKLNVQPRILRLLFLSWICLGWGASSALALTCSEVRSAEFQFRNDLSEFLAGNPVSAACSLAIIGAVAETLVEEMNADARSALQAAAGACTVYCLLNSDSCYRTTLRLTAFVARLANLRDAKERCAP